VIHKISIRPPVIYGHNTTKTTVGWRFSIQSNDAMGGPYTTDYTSKYQTAQASLSVAVEPGNGFSRGSWTVPSSHPFGQFRVVVELQWWKDQSIQGHVKVLYDWYRAINDDHSGSVNVLDRCFGAWFDY